MLINLFNQYSNALYEELLYIVLTENWLVFNAHNFLGENYLSNFEIEFYILHIFVNNFKMVLEIEIRSRSS